MLNFKHFLLVIFLLANVSCSSLKKGSDSELYDPKENQLIPIADKKYDDVPSIELGNEYKGYSKKKGSTATNIDTTKDDKERSIAKRILLYLPNRFLDLIDIFKVDLGVGPTFGAVVRLTKYGQVGFRSVAPFSLRAGLAGRRSPVFLESSSEFGVGPLYVESKDRVVDRGEFGVGADLFLFGAYAGINLEAIPDFIIGFFGLDLQEDDL